MSSSKDSTRISAILEEIQKGKQESLQFRSSNPLVGIPIPQPLNTGSLVQHIPDVEDPPVRIKKIKKIKYFKEYLKQGFLFFSLSFLCGNTSFRTGFLELFKNFANSANQITIMGQIMLSLFTTIAFILLQIIF